MRKKEYEEEMKEVYAKMDQLEDRIRQARTPKSNGKIEQTPV
jgi:glutathionyl-hydroquinone reductase